ncbi:MULTISPECIES: PLP-dependent aminotransferase family protein [Streptacidiphilus]|uniref:PLP-dependent aminotransferase family protein n=1 Tax=Streptacidiphilus cavernicola TaxID=3342716 RepID=A0ABV6UJX2_9ACTN|nr:PLP-dependent aminotransferase family protein [Streptacidiphilus jeojiense]
MRSSWTTSTGATPTDPATGEPADSPAWELLLPAASGPPRGRGRELGAALRQSVREGRLAPGTRLPSTRDLARDLGVSRGLVSELYAQLTAEGYLTSRQGSGTWVAALTRTPPSPVAARPGPPAAPVTDFRPGLPDLALFPRAAWSAAHRSALAGLPDAALDYPPPQGLPELRAALAELLSRRRGVVVAPEGVLVCSGVAQALTLLGRVLRARGHRVVALEDPGSLSQYPLLSAAGLRPVPVPVDAEGLDPGALAASGARAAVITPAHHFPTGVVHSPARRAALLDWAADRRGLLVEDDYDGDFRYDRAPVGALQGLAPDLVLYTGSVSKSLAPGLRLGWMAPPAELLDELVEAKRVTDLGNAVAEQAAFAGFLRSGRYDRQLRLCQRRYRERRDALIEALTAAAPGVRISGVAAGLHLIAEFPFPVPEAVCAAAGVRLRPLSDYCATAPAADATDAAPAPATAAHAAPARFVLGYAHLTPSEIQRALGRLAESFRSVAV